MRSYEQVYHVVWVLLGIGICLEAIRLNLWDPASGPRAGFIPFLAGLLVGFSGLLMLILGRARKPKERSKEEFWPDPTAAKRILFILLGLSALAFLMPFLGFLATSILVTAFLLRAIEPQRWITVILASVGCCLIVYWLFARFLQVSLPKGILGI